jgi:hypothetical protein
MTVSWALRVDWVFSAPSCHFFRWTWIIVGLVLQWGAWAWSQSTWVCILVLPLSCVTWVTTASLCLGIFHLKYGVSSNAYIMRTITMTVDGTGNRGPSGCSKGSMSCDTMFSVGALCKNVLFCLSLNSEFSRTREHMNKFPKVPSRSCVFQSQLPFCGHEVLYRSQVPCVIPTSQNTSQPTGEHSSLWGAPSPQTFQVMPGT